MKYKRNERELKDNNGKAKVVGITGGIASGKTVATDALRARGYYVVDADEVSRALTARGGDGERALVELFPDCAENGTLDRRRLRALISSDKSARDRLNAYTHPLILGKISELVKSANGPVVLSAPLLFETALGSLCDRTVCIICPREKRIERIVARDGVSEADARKILDAQISDSVRATLADYCIPSDRSADEFTEEVVELFDGLFGIDRRI